MPAAIMPAWLLGALLCLALFNLLALHSAWGWLFILATPLLVKQARYVLRESDPLAMRPMLEKTVKGGLTDQPAVCYRNYCQ
ncbi:1,4-dihydroxy-2-naphthoate octaprenyltransferase [Klebsiella pneumoniae]|uniref:1,4-dihydroxy-2-naphthoate octaprenyltransferase n=1 Tax=Klebsiella pneumoniae TaxID=573 RepID=A0A2X3CRT2_KLEPN|nr:1,4-dihydroxy-2-naphthoate octaprenyltransferase [Klebsiella pneumoniae]